MAANVAALLDKAKVMHRLPSDYKLAVVMGVRLTTLTNYRTGKTLPDARIIGLLCDLTGDDPALLAAEIEEQRAATPEARAIWHQVAVRLQQAAAAGVFSVLAACALAVGLPSGDASAKAVSADFTRYTSWNVARAGFLALFLRLLAPAVRYVRALSGRNHVSRAASTAAA